MQTVKGILSTLAGIPSVTSMSNGPLPDAEEALLQPRENAAELSKQLLTKGVIVKPWQEPGYEDHLRVSIGLPKGFSRRVDGPGPLTTAR